LKSLKFAGNPRLEAAFHNSPAIHIGESGEAVRLVQEALVDQGFRMPGSTKPRTGELDGGFGQETFDTIRRFQEQQGLEVDGVVGHETLRELDKLEFTEATVSDEQPPGDIPELPPGELPECELPTDDNESEQSADSDSSSALAKGTIGRRAGPARSRASRASSHQGLRRTSRTAPASGAPR